MNARQRYAVVLDWNAKRNQTVYHVALIEQCNYAPGWAFVDWFMKDIPYAAAVREVQRMNGARAEARPAGQTTIQRRSS